MRTNPASKHPSHKEEFWQQHILECSSRGISQRQYCQKHGLSLSTFSYWKKKLNVSKKERLHFYPLAEDTSPSLSSSPSVLETGISLRIAQGGQFHIELCEKFSVSCLHRVLSALEER